MPPKTRTSIPGERHHRRRTTTDKDRTRQNAEERAQRVPRSEAYDRNKRAAMKVQVRRWQDWD